MRVHLPSPGAVPLPRRRLFPHAHPGGQRLRGVFRIFCDSLVYDTRLRPACNSSGLWLIPALPYILLTSGPLPRRGRESSFEQGRESVQENYPGFREWKISPWIMILYQSLCGLLLRHSHLVGGPCGLEGRGVAVDGRGDKLCHS